MAARRPMEDFFCNPTDSFVDRGRKPRSRMDYQLTHAGYKLPDAAVDHKTQRRSLKLKATPKEFSASPVFWRTYNSEEELASPTSPGDLSSPIASSASSISDGGSFESFPEGFADTCNKFEQQCSCAQAVTLVSVGKAKVVSMLKLVDVPASPRVMVPIRTTPISAPVSRFANGTVSEPSRTPKAEVPPPIVDQFTPVPTTPKSISKLVKCSNSIREQPSLPNIQNAARSQFSMSSRLLPTGQLPVAADFLKHDPYPTTPRHMPDSPISRKSISPSRRRMHKLSSSLSQYVFGKDGTRSPSASSSDDEHLEDAIIMTASRHDLRSPTKPRMVPRGASERAPPLVLPAWSKGYESEIDVTQWPVKKDRSGSMPRGPVLHKRRRSIAAALTVPTQA
ncbi:hypothetical protein LTR78_000281 [Recurvomyces mirabilis]|uniref:Uncharacterized protein n=1 Tax=Recurvomyces mirabilis TaxID=574656 RepID=A0AAE0WXL6_9PEZI|nr:hypothetical protein LTR78_000281 [Recurvomyces mirabilis]KAK5161936.1 hypothetical protein LTS14_000282 [Recurvomyces mirabilis]